MNEFYEGSWGKLFAGGAGCGVLVDPGSEVWEGGSPCIWCPGTVITD